MAEEKRLQQLLGEREPLLEVKQANSYEEYRRFILFHMVVRNLPFIAVVCLVMVASGVAFAFFREGWKLGVVIAALGLAVPAAMILTAYLAARSVRKNGAFTEGENICRFYEDYMYFRCEDGSRLAERVVSYRDIYRIYETGCNVYIYLSKARAVFLKKTSIQAGGERALYALLSGNVDRRRLRGRHIRHMSAGKGE